MKELSKEELTDWLEHWERECSGIDRNERKGKSFCPDCDFKPSCMKADEQLRQLISQEKEDDEIHLQMIDIVLDLYEQLEQSQERRVDEEYIDEKVRKLHEKLYPNLGMELDMLEIMEDFLRSFAQEIQKPRITEEFINERARGLCLKIIEEKYISFDDAKFGIKTMLTEAGCEVGE